MTTTVLKKRSKKKKPVNVVKKIAKAAPAKSRAVKSTALSHAAQPAPALMDTSHSPFVKFRSLGMTDVRWTAGFWADRFEVCKKSMVPVMGKLLRETKRTHFIDNFLVAAGMMEGRHRGPKWNDGDFCKWFESAAALYAATRDPKLDKMMDEVIGVLAAAQRPDGYLHTDVQIGGLPDFGNPMHFEMYNMGHMITAAIVHHRATGKNNFLDLALKTAAFLEKVFANPTPELARHGICPAHLMSLVELYRLTGEKKHLDLAVKLLNMRDLVEKGDDDNQDRIPFRQQTEAIGHAVRATYLYAGAADLFAETGDQTLIEPLKKIWDHLTSKRLYVNGGCGALFDGASPDGAVAQQNITRVHQAFGRDYQLPHSTAHNETCAALGNVFWNWRMLQITGEPRYADLIEHTLYNAVLAGVSMDGTRFFYTNTLRQINPMPVELRWPRQRTDYMSCWCCPPNVVRTVAEVASYAYVKGDDSLSTVLYGGNVVTTTLADGSTISLKQETDYPWDGRVKFTMLQAPAKTFALSLRIPAWANGASVTYSGMKKKPKAGTYFPIRRRWKNGDVVMLNMPMPVRLIEANPYVEEARNQVVVARGPIVYCLESPDLGKKTRVQDVLLPRGSKLTPHKTSGRIAGLRALRGKAIARPEGKWDGSLYREMPNETAKKIEIDLIPYFAWDNRGQSEMSVFLPLAQ